ncbi:MAG: Unknown protein [uncultured Aureispira sp.]|uniref:Copper-binding protein MbnP-like domain-containing protein n=1 Tax=uncultured Aureispira sp. TaxID=1331704 RepID=A0A6S6RVZ6_9BACT|nr:MAG: Unknown protein [uncultured Aureispira sp.]
MKYWILIIFVLLLLVDVSGQERVLEIEFKAVYENAPLVLKSEVHQFQEKKIVFTRLKYYITNIELRLGEELVWKEKNSHHLIDLEKIETEKVVLDLPEKVHYDKISYQLGVDSLTNVSGAMGGDLDPTKGMYWAWNSGYINFKLEGVYEDCPTRKNKFQFHIGGYAGNMATVQKIEHGLTNERPIVIKVDVNQFLKELNLVEEHSLMRPSTKSVALAKRAALIFKRNDE